MRTGVRALSFDWGEVQGSSGPVGDWAGGSWTAGVEAGGMFWEDAGCPGARVVTDVIDMIGAVEISILGPDEV